VTAFDDELAALLALDALEADEQADAELRMGTFAMGLTDASAALAELAAVRPPAGLRDATLLRALERRPAGRPVGAAAPCEPPEAFDRTIADLHELLCSLSESEWEAPAHPEHGRVRDVVAHLIGVERLALRWLDPDDDVPLVPDHVAATRSVIAELAGHDPHDIGLRWHQSALAVAAAAARGDSARSITFHDLSTTVTGLLVMRTFERWAHAMDISAATGRPLLRLDPERMATLSGRLMAAVPGALAYRRTTAPGRTARFVLTGTAGGCYTVPLHPGTDPGEPDFTLVADTVDLCRVAARRLRPDQLSATIDGDAGLADLVLAGLDAFARD
jgi:uncharacterized protein (TIGR03083 family)